MKATKFEDRLYESGLSLQKVFSGNEEEVLQRVEEREEVKVFSGTEEEVLQRVEKRRGLVPSVVMSFSIRGPVKSQGVF